MEAAAVELVEPALALAGGGKGGTGGGRGKAREKLLVGHNRRNPADGGANTTTILMRIRPEPILKPVGTIRAAISPSGRPTSKILARLADGPADFSSFSTPTI